MQPRQVLTHTVARLASGFFAATIGIGLAIPSAGLAGSDWDIYTVDGNGGNLRNLTPAARSNQKAPVFSPDGRQIAYVDEGQLDVVRTLPAGGGEPSAPLASGRDVDALEYSPRGDLLAFSSNEGGVTTRLVSVDGGVVREFSGALDAKFSPDGASVVFSREGYDTDHYYEELFVADIASGETRPLTSTERDENLPTFSPDGSRIAFVRPGGFSIPPTLNTISSSGADEREIFGSSSDFFQISCPTYSPDGAQIAFSAGRSFPPPISSDLYVVDSRGGAAPVNLTGDLDGGPACPSFTSDGRIVFALNPSSGAGAGEGEVPIGAIYVMNPDGSGKTNLTGGRVHVTSFPPISSTAEGGRFVFTSDFDNDPPDTKILKGPDKETHKRKAEFTFRASDFGRGIHYECRLISTEGAGKHGRGDGAQWRSCKSPAAYRVKVGIHVFKVRAIDEVGNVDPSPDRHRWRVVD